MTNNINKTQNNINNAVNNIVVGVTEINDISLKPGNLYKLKEDCQFFTISKPYGWSLFQKSHVVMFIKKNKMKIGSSVYQEYVFLITDFAGESRLYGHGQRYEDAHKFNATYFKNIFEPIKNLYPKKS